MLYATSIQDSAWEFIAHLFPPHTGRGRARKYSPRAIVDACFYVVDHGTKWRNLLNDFPPWKIVYDYFRIWSLSGLWKELNAALVESVRFSAGRLNSPSLASVDSQSQTAEPGISGRGLDGGKKVNGRKRHIAVDSMGLLLVCICTSANTADAKAGDILVAELNNEELYPEIKKILGDNSYKTVGSKLRVPISVESAERIHGTKGFVPAAFRWAVERTFAWLNRQRRLVRNYEKNPDHQISMNYIGSIRICIKRLQMWLCQ